MRHNTRQIVSIDDIKQSDPRLEVVGVFNPGAVRVGHEIVMLVRVAEAAKQHEENYLFSPRFEPRSKQVEIDKVVVLDRSDHRKPIIEKGLRRLAFISHLEIVKLSADAKKVISVEKHFDLYPKLEYEEFGIEDPRITQIGDTYYITYVAVSQKMSVVTALMSTTDFKHFRRHGIIFDADTKDVVIFPQEINHQYVALIRPYTGLYFRQPAILLAWSRDLLYWGNYQFVLGTRENWWDEIKIGAGVPPILTKQGWLHIYHGVHKNPEDVIGHYAAGVFLTAPDDPARVIARGKQSVFEAETPFEKKGFVENVIFPTAALKHHNEPNQITVLYGGADSSVGAFEVSVDDLVNHALKD